MYRQHDLDGQANCHGSLQVYSVVVSIVNFFFCLREVMYFFVEMYLCKKSFAQTSFFLAFHRDWKKFDRTFFVSVFVLEFDQN